MLTYALCEFLIPVKINIPKIPAKAEDVSAMALYFSTQIKQGNFKLVDVSQYFGEIDNQGDYQDFEPTASTFVTVSFELEQNLIKTWEINKKQIVIKAINELQKDDLHFSAYWERGDESHVYLIKDYE